MADQPDHLDVLRFRRHPLMSLREPVLTCTYRDLPCRILQRTQDDSRLLLLSHHPENT